MAYYFDSSALVKRYVEETGTEWINHLCANPASDHFYTVRISGAEIVAALFNRMRTGSITAPDAQAAALSLQQVRTSMGLSPIIFICADQRLNTTAISESLVVKNPNDPQ